MIELIKKYSKGKDESIMWKSVEYISTMMDKYLDKDKVKEIEKGLYHIMQGGHYDEYFAKHQVSKMYYYDENNNKVFGPYWNENEVKSIYDEHESEIRPYNFYDFFVTMNMIKSDFCPLLKMWFPEYSEKQMLDKIISLSINWLKDDDNPFGDEKVWCYFNSHKC